MPIRERNQPDSSQQKLREHAETIAINMIAFLMSDDDRSGGFFGTTGLSPDDIRAGIQQPAFLGGVMDYLLSREDLLVEFCTEQNIDPMQPMRVRPLLP
jgi:hypothetical protein